MLVDTEMRGEEELQEKKIIHAAHVTNGTNAPFKVSKLRDFEFVRVRAHFCPCYEIASTRGPFDPPM